MDEARYVLSGKIVRNTPKKLLDLYRKHTLKRSSNVFGCIIPMPKIDDEKDEMSSVPYANQVESLMHVMLSIRSDICFKVSLISC